MRFALDAKYRRYSEIRVKEKEARKFGYRHQWECDALGHAKQKYRDGYGYDAAWIVHSDPAYTFFGGGKFPTAPHREAKAGLSLYPGHTYGAVYAVPFETANLETLLRCLLMYHAGWYDICWTCRKRLSPKPGTGIAGVYYQCEEGHDFWVKSNCTRSNVFAALFAALAVACILHGDGMKRWPASGGPGKPVSGARSAES